MVEMTRESKIVKAHPVGINHVALEVGDIDDAIEFYGQLFEFSLRSKSVTMAEIDMGDQFLAFMKSQTPGHDRIRHFGLVVDDRNRVLEALEILGIEILPGRGLNFRDPWGNYVQIVDYRNIQFMKTPEVLNALGIYGLEKSAAALQEISEKGFTSE